jgi:hypothetical protein
VTKEPDTLVVKTDDLDAVKNIITSLQGFEKKDQERIIRWALEKIGLDITGSASVPMAPTIAEPPDLLVRPARSTPIQPQNPQPTHASSDIRTFFAEKNPQRDTHVAATVAYFYRFEAPEQERKEEINANDLREALRKAGRPGQLLKPLRALQNARTTGLLDSGTESGHFCINSVGENLVGMTLPGNGSAKRPRRQRVKKKVPSGQRPVRKQA